MAGNSKANTKSLKKGANFLCRIANPNPKKLCYFVKRLPKTKMKETQFREIMGKDWFSNEHQAPEQWGLYYIDGENYYPRFNRDVSLKEAERYLSGWLKRFIVINPYSKFKTSNDSNLVLSIVHELVKDPNEKDLKKILTNIIGGQEPFVLNDILVNALDTYSEVLKVKTIDKDNELFEVYLQSDYQDIINKKYIMNKKDYFELFDGIITDFDPNMPLQQITYGAPGTGKSFKIMRDTAGKSVIRTTFHPDTDYSTFVGAYKPVMEEVEMHVVPVVLNNGASFDQNKGSLKEKRISYKFVKQAFLKAYLGAWKKYSEADGEAVDPQFLIIEEINRGNCAQIFGDLFQLLDRNDKNKFSVYPIEADADLQKEIKHAFTEEYDGGNDNPYKLDKNIEIEGAVDGYFSNFGATLSEDIQEGRVLLLPPNLYIWATMNTSDQSLFPIDSAFKRRWDWKYIKIKEGKDDEGNNLDWKIAIDGKKINGQESLSWWTFVQKINEIIASMTSSADKQLGYFFCKAKDGVISGETFVSKVIFYLWNDVFKDYGFEDASLFRYETIEDGKTVEKDLTFPDFYDEDGENVNGDRVVNFLEKVLAWHTPNDNA